MRASRALMTSRPTDHAPGQMMSAGRSTTAISMKALSTNMMANTAQQTGTAKVRTVTMSILMTAGSNFTALRDLTVELKMKNAGMPSGTSGKLATMMPAGHSSTAERHLTAQMMMRNAGTPGGNSTITLPQMTTLPAALAQMKTSQQTFPNLNAQTMTWAASECTWISGTTL